jgi:16S rRNA (guanine(1405)-N(7))-methyltransferase
MSDLDEIVSAVTSSKKYREVCTDTVRRIAGHELERHGGLKAAVKATKRRLHQVYGAFGREFDYEGAYRRLEAAYGTGSDQEIHAVCRQVLRLHSSTRERLAILDRFYAAVFAVTGQPTSILDLGCGLNPLTWPWMDLPATTRYVAIDINASQTAFLNRYLALAGLEPLARCHDILARPPGDKVDVVFLLKMSPSLERQRAGATLDLIQELRAPYIVTSYAIKSLGGREKGMVTHYQQQFSTWAEERQWPVETLAFETELVFVVKQKRVDNMDGSDASRDL